MCPNLLHPLQVITEFVIQLVGQQLRVLAVPNIFLSVEEPVRDLVLTRILHDCDDPVYLCVCVCARVRVLCVCVWCVCVCVCVCVLGRQQNEAW